MPIVSKNVFIVKCDISLFESNFSRKKNSEIINHLEIRQRLTNNDVFKNPPTDDIVQFQIMKKLNSFKDCKKTEFLFFYRDSVDGSFIDALKEIVNQSEFPVNYHLLLESDIKDSKLKKKFNSIQFMERDDKNRASK